MSVHVRHLCGVYYELVLRVCVLYQRSESCISVLLPAFRWGFLAVGAHACSGVGIQLW